jgi:hypothetical protein
MMTYKNRSLTTVFDRNIGERVELNVQDYLKQAKQSMEHFIAFDIFDSTKEIPLGDLKSVDALIDFLNQFHNYFRDMRRFNSIKAMAARRTKTDAIQAICINLTNITPLSYDINIKQLETIKYHMVELKDELNQLEKQFFKLSHKDTQKQGITLYEYRRKIDWNI